jgi:isocitrate dehydrogenase
MHDVPNISGDMKMSEQTGGRITMENGKLKVPANPTIPFIIGDGSGPDIWRAAQPVMDAAVEKAYHGNRKIVWKEVLAGEKALNEKGNYLPEETLQTIREYLVGIKGPLATPIGGGIRSLNVALRKELDLYVCLRPVRYFEGMPSPVKFPEKLSMTIFRENTEDVYAGIEFENGTPDNILLKKLLKENFPKEYAKMPFPGSSGIGIKPVSEEGSKRLVRAALQFAVDNQRRSVTLVHKGNIMKYTEGSFRKWGYEVAAAEFAAWIYSNEQYDRTKAEKGDAAANEELAAAQAAGKIHVKDLISDNAFARFLTYPQEYDVVASTNLNGDYLSDFLAAQVGGLGIAPGANINYVTGVAVFEATHGTAPRSVGLNRVNPCSVLLSGEMMLRYMGWNEAADRVVNGIASTIREKLVTNDLYQQMTDAHLLKTTEFGAAIIQHMD